MVLISVILLAVTIAGIALASYFQQREKYKALRKPTQNNTKEFLQAIELFKSGEQGGIIATGLWLGPEELKHLEELEEIPYLNFNKSTIKDSDMELIAKIPGLMALDLSETRVTNKGLKLLENHPTIRVLWLNCIPVSDEGLKSIVTIPQLGELHLWQTSTTDAGCVLLSKVPSLEVLSLDSTLVTDRGIRALSPLKNLRELKTGGTAVTKNGRDDARKRWPGIRMNSEFDAEISGSP